MTLKSVDEHNEERSRRRRETEEAARRTGVACPKCGDELMWSSDFCMTLGSNETTRQASCKRCRIEVTLED